MSQDIGQRIATAREAKGWNQSELARELGVSPQSVQHWEKGGGVKHARLTTLAQTLGVTLEQLMFGDDSRVTAVRESQAHYATGGDGIVPVLDWIRIEDWLARRDPAARDHLLCAVPIGPRGFAVRITGASGKPLFTADDIAFVDPDVPPATGRIVVVIPGPAEPPILRRMIVEAGERYLEVINPAWPGAHLDPLPAGATIAGTVIGK